MSDDRSERLRKQRNRSAEKVKSSSTDEPVKPDKTDEPDETGKPVPEGSSEASKPVKPDKPESPDEPEKPEEPDETVIPVKQRENWGPTQIHLPDRLENQMGLVLDQTNIKMRSDGAEPLEKLMHWYPLVVQQGLDAVAEMDAEEVQEEIAEFEDE